MKKIISFILCLVALLALNGCDQENEIVFADAGWDSVQFHNAVAGYIAVEAFGYDSWREIRGTTPITHQAIIDGQIDVHMEEWIDNIPTYSVDVKAGNLVEVGVNYNDNYQGLYVPRYLIEGDEERGIKALAPNLKTVQDLKDYYHLFPDDTDPSKGRIYGAMPGWEVDLILQKKIKYSGLDEYFNYFSPGSDAAMIVALSDAFERGIPVVGYYWEPTWLLGLYDFVLLEDEPFTNIEDFQEGKTEMPPMDIKIAVSNDFHDKNPEFCKFLENYYSTSELISTALAYKQENSFSGFEQTAKWFLQENISMLDDWLDADKAELVREALKG